jgi:hypothetical protein
MGGASDRVLVVSFCLFAVYAEDARHIPNKHHIDPMPHQTMDGEARAAYESQSLQIRAELKKWESDWALASRGKKPGRDDIKQNPDIGASIILPKRLRLQATLPG